MEFGRSIWDESSITGEAKNLVLLNLTVPSLAHIAEHSCQNGYFVSMIDNDLIDGYFNSLTMLGVIRQGSL